MASFCVHRSVGGEEITEDYQRLLEILEITEDYWRLLKIRSGSGDPNIPHPDHTSMQHVSQQRSTFQCNAFLFRHLGCYITTTCVLLWATIPTHMSGQTGSRVWVAELQTAQKYHKLTCHSSHCTLLQTPTDGIR